MQEEYERLGEGEQLPSHVVAHQHKATERKKEPNTELSRFFSLNVTHTHALSLSLSLSLSPVFP